MAWLRLQPLTSAFLHFGLVTFVLFLNCLRAEAGDSGDVPSAGQNNESCSGSSDCKEGGILPIWYPENPSLGDKSARVLVYFVALIYMFLGVSIIADRFMASIEVITSQEREVTIKKPNGETSTTTIRVWNETVSNLTLMALGSSAPEILLSLPLLFCRDTGTTDACHCTWLPVGNRDPNSGLHPCTASAVSPSCPSGPNYALSSCVHGTSLDTGS